MQTEMVKQSLEVHEALVGLLGTAMGWIGFLLVLIILSRWGITALSRAAAFVIINADETTRRMLISYLVNKEITLDELYRELRSRGGTSTPDT